MFSRTRGNGSLRKVMGIYLRLSPNDDSRARVARDDDDDDDDARVRRMRARTRARDASRHHDTTHTHI